MHLYSSHLQKTLDRIPSEENTLKMAETQQTHGPGGVPKGAKTTDYYRVDNIPERFNNPGGCYIPGNPVFSCQLDLESKNVNYHEGADELFQGYTEKAVHPMYRTSNSDYGNRAPSVHTMPTTFNARSQKFSGHLGKCGMYRNHSLNTAQDTSNVPEH